MRAIAYPFCAADARVAGEARMAGFSAGYTCDQVAVTPLSDPMRLGRLNPSVRSLGEFALQVARAFTRALRPT